MKILGFYSSGEPEIDELLDVRLRTNSASSRIWTSVIGIQELNEEECSLLSMLYCESLQKHIFISSCNDFESHCRMFLEAKHCSSFDDAAGQLAPFFLIVRSWAQKGLILRTLKIRRKVKNVNNRNCLQFFYIRSLFLF